MPSTLAGRIRATAATTTSRTCSTYVTGIQCTAGGEPCQADGKGVCRRRRHPHARMARLPAWPPRLLAAKSATAWTTTATATPTKADDLCPKDEICVKGRCEPPCGTGEFRCASGELCVAGVCVEEGLRPRRLRVRQRLSRRQVRFAVRWRWCAHTARPVAKTCAWTCARASTATRISCASRRASSDGSTVVGVCTSCDCRGLTTMGRAARTTCASTTRARPRRATPAATASMVTASTIARTPIVPKVKSAAPASAPAITAAAAAVRATAATGASGGDDGSGLTSSSPTPTTTTARPGTAARRSGSGGTAKDKSTVEAVGCGCALTWAAVARAAALWRWPACWRRWGLTRRRRGSGKRRGASRSRPNQR